MDGGGRYFERQQWCRHCPVILAKELGSCQRLELSESGSSHLVNTDSREGIRIRNHTLNELTSWLPGSRADTSLDPDLPNYFVHDQSQTEPRNHINAGKEEENGVVDVLNEALSPTTFSSYFSVKKYIISVDLEEGRKVFAALVSSNSSAHQEPQKTLF